MAPIGKRRRVLGAEGVSGAHCDAYEQICGPFALAQRSPSFPSALGAWRLALGTHGANGRASKKVSRRRSRGTSGTVRSRKRSFRRHLSPRNGPHRLVVARRLDSVQRLLHSHWPTHCVQYCVSNGENPQVSATSAICTVGEGDTDGNQKRWSPSGTRPQPLVKRAGGGGGGTLKNDAALFCPCQYVASPVSVDAGDRALRHQNRTPQVNERQPGVPHWLHSDHVT